jgi:hypothetical protein
MRILLPGVMMDESSLSQVKRVAEILDKTKGANVSFGRIEDVMAGMRPLPQKPQPVREIPDFPLHTYNFLKRPD